MSQFSEDLRLYFKGMEVNSITCIHQIQRVMLGESNEFTAICQIAYFLNINPAELLESEITEEKVIQEKESHYIRNRAITDWEKFDKENVVRFEAFCKGIYDGLANDNVRPERVSEKRIYKFLGITSYGFKNMPECMAVYKKYAEPYEKSWARKLVWAYEVLKTEEKSIYWSNIRKLAGVKKEKINEVLVYLDKYGNGDTVNELLKTVKINLLK